MAPLHSRRRRPHRHPPTYRHDVACNILSAFDASLYEYGLASLTKHEVEIKTDSHITSLEKDRLCTKEDGKIPFGMPIWNYGE
ncbi:hypothetical protein ABVK25_011854 [Lepraria finkii]|uniref:Uncharacterized protein n=1 Tax=Lepraria finkii TaxID=1340010 RepID=A0ABR4AP60_9LECA